jgi:hypothetical protein
MEDHSRLDVRQRHAHCIGVRDIEFPSRRRNDSLRIPPQLRYEMPGREAAAPGYEGLDAHLC